MKHFFINSNKTLSSINNSDELYHHLSKVMRIKTGEQIELVLTNQTIDLVEVSSIDKDKIELKFIENYTRDTEMPIDVTVVISPLKNDRTEWLLQKATELGVKKFIFVDFKNSVVVIKRIENKLERYQKIVQAAAEQSQRNMIPAIEFSNLENLPVADLQIIANENYVNKSDFVLSKIVSKQTKNLIAIFGPEGGFDNSEIELLEQRNFISINLGPRILRAETAPLYLLSVVSSIIE